MMTHRSRNVLRWACLAVMIAAAPSMGQGLLTRVKVTPSDSTAGTGAIYTISFRTSLTGTGIPANGKIRIKFPPSFTDSTVVAAINDSGLTSGYSAIKDSNHVLMLTRDGLGNALTPGDTVQIKLAIVYNSTVADTFRLSIETLTAASVRIDSAKSPVFRIIHAPLHHFTINNVIIPPVAGVPFNLVMSARDAHENVVKTFSGAVTFTANQGTVIPAASGAFVQGLLTQPVRTNLAGAGRVMTAAAATGQFGNTNAFTVNPNVLHHFAVSNIPTPQTAGLGFPVTFTAQDSLNNTVTAFAGTAGITAAIGAVTPATSGAFANGVRNETLTLLQVSVANRITLTGSGKSGQSNSFNVNVGALDHFTIAAITNKTAGAAFNIILTAKDANENTVTSFSGTVNLSDNTGTLSPLTSGAFVNGARTQSVTITKARTGAIISVNDGANHFGQSNGFNVNHAALDHFTVTNTADGNISGQTAGAAFNIKIVAQDAFNNTVASHTGAGSAVTITNATASIAPVTSSNFSSGVLASQSVTINESNSADAITVSGGSPARNGISNTFAVSAGALAAFQVANISDPQTAGATFPLLVTAVDVNGNTATSFTGTVNLSVNGGGAISPNVSGNFIAGVWNGSVSISNSGSNRIVTVSNGTFSANSNSFSVVSGTLDHFVIDAIGNQTAGQNFSVTVRARDANDNPITHSGTVILSDNTGTLTASPLVFTNHNVVTINDAKLTKAQSNVVITASGSGKTVQSTGFTVGHAALDHFVVTNTSGGNVGTQTAGTAFPVRVVTRDMFDNTVTSFNQSVTITDLTGVNITSANFSGGVLSSQNVTINQTRADNQLTAAGGAPVKTGASNLFNINAGALNGFSIDTISDQATGEPFTITLRARDAQNNIKTDFTGTVTLTDLTGTITPAVSGTFFNGVRNESVRITQTRANNTISVTGGGKSGVSNAFNVQAVTVDHFEISAIGNQTAGTAFSVTFIARDQSNNIVTNFAGTVTVSDLSGSIAPATSNNFIAGQLTQNFTLTKSFTNNRLTVTGVGKSNQSNLFNVSPAPLAKFAISPLADQNAGQSFPLLLTAQDQFDNTITGFTGAVTIALNSGTILPTTSGAFSAGTKTVSVTIPAAGNNRTISVNDGSGHTGVSNSFDVSASGLDHFVFSNIGTVQAGTIFSFTITAKDANGNDVSFNGTVNLTDATGTLTPTSVTMSGASASVNNGRITKKQDGVFITAAGGGKSTRSDLFNVTAAPLHRVKVVEGSSGPGSELTTKTRTADQILPVHAAGYDVFDNYIADQNVDWLVAPLTANIGSFDPAANAAATTFFANIEGTGRIVANHASAIDDSSGVITVTPGAAYRVKILNGTVGLTADVLNLTLTTGQTRDVHAASFDADGNYIQDVSVSWNVTGNIGTLSQNSGITTRFTATTQGSGVISADHPSLIDGFTGTISVASGTLARVRIVEGESGNGSPFTGRNVTTDGSFTLHAAGYDVSNNYLGDFTVTWLVRGGIGVVSPTINASTMFDPQVPNPGRIVANHDTALDDSTNLFTVSVGNPVRVKVLTGPSGNTAEVQDVTLVTGDPLDVHASSFDSDNNRIEDVNVTWRLTGNIGTFTPPFGSATRLTTTTTGFGALTADHATYIDDATGTIEVRSGNLSYVKVVLGPSGPGVELGNINRTTDEVVSVHAAGYDAQNNYLSDRAVEWSLLGDAIGDLSSLNGAATTLTLRRPGTARLVANDASARDDSSGVITVAVGALRSIKILAGSTGDQLEVEERALNADESFAVHAGGFDEDNNYINDFAVDWFITGAPVGTLTPTNGRSSTFSANKTGVGQIRAVHATAGSDLTGSITVTPGQLSFIKIYENAGGQGAEVADKTIRTDQELRFFAAGFDFDGNYIRDESVTWSSAGSLLPVVNASGASITFQPTLAPATGTFRAAHASVGSDETGTITVNVGPLHHVAVLTGASGPSSPQGAATMFPGDQITVHAGGFDARNNYILNDEVVNWTVDGNIGNLSATNGISTIFTAVRAGNTGSIRADHPNPEVLDANSGTIAVTNGAVASLILRTAANNGGAAFNTLAMTADDEVTVYAAGYDAGNNYQGDVNVTWTSTGTLAPTVNAMGSSFVFSPTDAAANNSVNGAIVGTYPGGISDATGLITVLPGAPKGTVDLTATPNSLQANGTSTSNIISGAIVDSENNNAGGNRRFTVSITPATSGQIVDADVDPATPGRQIATNAQSQLNFTFRAGTIGGVATINVSSVSGGANGAVQISLGNLNISQISAPATVTRGQAGVNVSMSVQNLGSSPILNLSGGLTFTGAVDRTPEYTVAPDNNNPVSIPGNSPATLNYLVTVSTTATLETIAIDGTVSGTVSGTPVSKTGANLPDNWQVLRAAQLTIQTVSTSVDTVARGQNNLAVTVRVSNNLGQQNSSFAAIDSVRLRFRQGAANKSGDYTITPNGGNPTTISGNSTADFSFVVNVNLGATLGDIVIDAEAYGRDANSGAAANDLNAATTDDWTVIAGNPFRIVAMEPSQLTVTAGMSREWTVKMQLQNLSTGNVILNFAPDKTFIRFFIGNEVTSTYAIVPPTQLDNNGGTVLRANTTGALTFRITQTGNKNGIATIAGFVEGTDAAGLRVMGDTNVSGAGAVTVQTRGTLEIREALQLSQATATAGQSAVWTITARVTNGGESSLRFLKDSTRVSVGNNLNYFYTLPQKFTDGDSIIEGGEIKTLAIVVRQTGNQTGSQPINVRLKGLELNSNTPVTSNPGSASVLVQSAANLVIQQVRASQAKVTAGQTEPWRITLVVRNLGESAVSVQVDTATNVRFRINNQIQTTGYTAGLLQASWLGTGARLLGGISVDSLRFSVNTTGGTPGVAGILAKVTTIETNSAALRLANDNGTATVTVQTLPVITYISNSLDPKTVNNNSQYAFKVRVRNSGGATVELQSNLTRFVFGSGAVSFSANLDQNKTRSIAPGDTTLFFVGDTIAAGMPKIAYTPTLELRGSHNGNGFQRNLSVDTNELRVTDPGRLQVISMHSSQATVTQEMEKDWHIMMTVANNGGFAVRLDSVDLQLFNGGLVTRDFQIEKPVKFLGANNNILAAQAQDSLRFEIRRTGTKAGNTSVLGFIRVVDQSNNQKISTPSSGNNGSFVVQAPALLDILALAPSHANVTVNQAAPQGWFVDMAVRNSGGSDVRVVFDTLQTRVNLSLNFGDYRVQYPVALVEGGTLIPANGTRTLRFNITQTGTQLGRNNITGQIRTVELNSNDVRLDDTQSGGSGFVNVQTAARLRYVSTTLLPESAPNLPRVNTGQTFDVQLLVENTGGEAADNVLVRLTSDGSSIISPNEKLIFNGVSGGLTNSAVFTVTASSSENLDEKFTATIISAKGRNTGLNTAVEPGGDNTENAIVQRPADLQILSVLPSTPTVQAFSNIPWEIYVVLQNTGGAAVVLDPPAVSDIEITIEAQVPPGFNLVPPTALAQSGDLILPGGQIDTLVYRVVSTGSVGGVATIAAAIGGKDQNNAQRFAPTKNGQITVQTRAAVQIATAQPTVNNFFQGTEVGLVNTNQAFAIEVTVSNPTLEDVKDVVIELSTNGGSQIQPAQKTIASVPQNTQNQVSFNVSAAASPTLGAIPENFIARIVSATAARSGGPAQIFNPSDSTAQVRIQLPAELTLAAASEFGNLTTRQRFEFSATVNNRSNAAEVDDTGRMTLVLPDNFAIEEPDPNAFERAFEQGQKVTWKLRAPENATQAAIVVRLTQLPRDKNSLANAAATNFADTVDVSVVFSSLSINKTEIVSPAGAADSIVSTTQAFKIESSLSFSTDLSAKKITLTLPPNAGYDFKSGSVPTLENFDENDELSWEVLAPSAPVNLRWFMIEAEGVTGTGRQVFATDSVLVQTVQRTTLSFELKIIKPGTDTTPTFAPNQEFKIQAILTNVGAAAAIDTAEVRLQPGETGVTTSDSLQKKIYIARGESSGIIEWVAKAPGSPTPPRNLSVQLLNLLNDENSGGPAAWDNGEQKFNIAVTVRTDTVGTLFVEQPVVSDPAGAADNILSTEQEFKVRATITGRNLSDVAATLSVPPGFNFVVEGERIQRFPNLTGEQPVIWRVIAPVDRRSQQPIYVITAARDANSDRQVEYTTSNLVIDVVSQAELALDARITNPASARNDAIVSVEQPFEITAYLRNSGEASVIGADSIRLELPAGYSTSEPLNKSSFNNEVRWQITARNTPSRTLEVITVTLLRPYPLDQNTGKAADVVGVSKTLNIRTEAPSLTVTEASASAGIKSGPVINQQKDIPVLALDLRNAGDENASHIVVKSMTFYVNDRQGAELPPNAAVSGVRIAARDDPNKIFGQANITGTNPVSIVFAATDTVFGGSSHQVVVLIDVANNATAGDFFLTVRNGENIEAVNADSPERRVDVTLAGGAITSVASVLSSESYDESFYNFPNPFSPNRDGATKFNYTLPQDSQVDFSLFTMLGELVYAKTYQSGDPQGRAGARNTAVNKGYIEWDGRNGNGRVVLNGVYLAVLKTAAGTVKTKVAVVK